MGQLVFSRLFYYHMKLVVPTPNSKRMNTQRIPLGQIFKIELTPRAELQRRISENAHKLIVIQHQHEGKVETNKGTLMGYNTIDILDHEVCLGTEEKLVSIKLSEILQFVGKGWLDSTRIAASNSQLWRQILQENHAPALQALKNFATICETWIEALERGDFDQVESLLQAGKATRDAVASRHLSG